MPLDRVPELMPGVMPEYKSKQVLKALGIQIPQGALARNIEKAQAIADEIGYPVALKAQSAELSHKSDAGGVVLNLANPEELATGWRRMRAAIDRARPGLVLDGVLVEAMGARGAELIVGARNDPEWGAVLLIGSGGVHAELLKDVRLLPPDLSVEALAEEIYRLKMGALLRGFRGNPALDVHAVAQILHRLGNFVLAAPQVQEVDVNPVIVYPEGQGAVALDALIVTRL
jgi:succinyl-CoA synthetase beta subunit